MRQVVVTVSLLLVCAGLFAQEQRKDSIPSAAQQQQERCGLKKLDQCLKDLAHDQAGIWTSPLRVNAHDAIWLVPFAGATGAAFAYDEDALRRVGTTNRGLVNKSETISEFGSPYATFGEAGAMYLLGALKHNDHLRETGILGAEAVANASLVAEGLKLATNRERPNEGLGTGRFWPHGTRDYSLDSSFPSGHAAASWALARVIAAEYPGWWTKLGAYSFATAISASRITGRQHFPSDVVVGSTFGYLIGGYVVRHHSSVDQAKTTYALLPTFDRAQHAYGVTLILSRNARQVEESEQAVKDFSPIASWSNQEPQTKPQTAGVPPHLPTPVRPKTIPKGSSPSASFGSFQTIARLAPTRSCHHFRSRTSFGSRHRTASITPRLFLPAHLQASAKPKIRLPNSVKGRRATAVTTGTHSPIKPSKIT